MVGPWIEMHSAWGTNDKEKAYFEQVAKTFITILGGEAFSEKGMHDYSYREWAGTMVDLYKARFEKYFYELRKCSNNNVEPSINWYEFDYNWTIIPSHYPVNPTIQATVACKAIFEKYHDLVIQIGSP